MKEVKFTDITELDITKTFECGQCFRWNADESGTYTGVARGHAARLRQDGGSVFILAPSADIEVFWHDYFDLDRDYAEIGRQLCISEYMQSAVQFGSGIRILRQDPWEALCSFIISQNNHIPRIKSIISTLCKLFGEPLDIYNDVLYTFPSSAKLSRLNESDLAPVRCGYRAKYLISAAKSIEGGALNLTALSELPQEKAKAQLKQLYGVGEKVADCVLLYGLNMLDAFPVDVWIKKAMIEHLGTNFNPKCFSPYGGIAQQLIFHNIRNRKM